MQLELTLAEADAERPARAEAEQGLGELEAALHAGLQEAAEPPEPVRLRQDERDRRKEAGDATTDAGFQIHQSLIGFGSGGVFGTGFGQGQQKLGYLPYAYSDFLFSTIGEEWGFVGVFAVVFLFGLFCWLGFRIARTAADPFGQYLAVGLTATIGLTAFMHMAVSLGLMPTTGLTLPFMSYGRSSQVISLLGTGILINIGRLRGRPRGAGERGTSP